MSINCAIKQPGPVGAGLMPVQTGQGRLVPLPVPVVSGAGAADRPQETLKNVENRDWDHLISKMDQSLLRIKNCKNFFPFIIVICVYPNTKNNFSYNLDIYTKRVCTYSQFWS
jgi:hypothetical protein